MEELRSTEILDREIEADAQKKAAKIVANAVAEADAIRNGVADRVKASIDEKTAAYEAKISLKEKEAQAYIPLEKERFLVVFYDNQVNKAVNNYFIKNGDKKILSLLESKLKQCTFALENKAVSIKYFGGLNEKQVLTLVKNGFKGTVKDCSEIAFEKSGEEPLKGNEIHQGIIIESDDNTVKIRLTMDEIIRELKDKYSEELATTLFSGVLPQ